MPKQLNLVLVESSIKARIIWALLRQALPQETYVVEATNGQLKDLPREQLGITHEYDPEFQIRDEALYARLLKHCEEADVVYIATDPDREGEFIGWCAAMIAAEAGHKQDTVRRIKYNQITTPALLNALAHPMSIDMKLVESQITRRLVDRVLGFGITRHMWNAIGVTSTGRVQSVILDWIVTREVERLKFDRRKRWFGGVKLIHPLDPKQKWTAWSAECPDEASAKLWVKQASAAKPLKLREDVEQLLDPPGPCVTADVLSAGSLDLSVRERMEILQRLYNRGLITYHRTNDAFFSPEFLLKTAEFLKVTAGADFVHIRTFPASSASVHEAIRPVEIKQIPSKLDLTEPERLVYKYIWVRALACVSSPAQIVKQSLDFVEPDTQNILFTIEGERILCPGWLRTTLGLLRPANRQLPETLKVLEAKAEWDLSPLPKLYTEGELIRKMQVHGVGRPSTWSGAITTLLDNNLVKSQKGSCISSTERGEVTWSFLQLLYPEMLSTEVTKELENKIDYVSDSTTRRQIVGHYSAWVKAHTEVPSIGEGDNLVWTDGLYVSPHCKDGYTYAYINKANAVYLECSVCKTQLPVEPTETGLKVFVSRLVTCYCSHCGAETLRLNQGKYGRYLKCDACGMNQPLA